MKVKVRYFALVAEMTGCREEALELPDSATVSDALAAVAARHPRLGDAADHVAPHVVVGVVGELRRRREDGRWRDVETIGERTAG